MADRVPILHDFQQRSLIQPYRSNYFTGIPDVVTTDLRSYGFGETFGVTRTWSDVNNTGQFGNGWVTTQNAYLFTY